LLGISTISVYIVKKSLKLGFHLISRTIIYFHVYRILDFSILYRSNASVLCQSECARLLKTVNIVVFLIKRLLKHLPKREITKLFI